MGGGESIYASHDVFIKKAGRWLSGAYEVYLSIPERDRETMARRMAAAQLGGDARPERSQSSWSSLYAEINSGG